MDGSLDRMELLSTVEAELIYIQPPSEKPRTLCYKLPPGVPHSNYELDRRRHAIRDGRPLARAFTLDREGLALHRHRSAFRAFGDRDEICRAYYPEAEAVIRSLTGADRVLVFGHTVRRRQHGGPNHSDDDRLPVLQVHVDRTDSFGRERVRACFPDEADALLEGRIEIINLWRPISEPVLEMPLAVCDARSVRPEQLVSVEMVFAEQSFEAYRLTYDPGHRWFYFPEMRTDEVLLLKCYDSATDGRARYTPHTAFADPTTPPGAPSRESIEVRAIAVHAS